MASLTRNLELLQNGKQGIIDEVNNQLTAEDRENLAIDCGWDSILALLEKIHFKKDATTDVNSNEIYTDLCSGQFNQSVVTNATTLSNYGLYQQKYIPEIIAEKATSIGDYFNKGNISLTKLVAPKVTTVGAYAFQDCTSLSEIQLASCLTVGPAAFKKCTALSTANLINCKTVNNQAFRNCGPATISLPEATTIGDYAFVESNITSLYAPKVTSFGAYACGACSKLTSVDISSLTIISDYAFSNYIYNDNNWITGTSGLTNILMPNVTRIGSSGLQGCTKLTSITCKNLQTTDYSAGSQFYGCTNLKRIEFTASTNIKFCEQTFMDCVNLEEIILPESCTTVQIAGDSVFYNCKKLSDSILEKITYLNSSNPFGSCSSLVNFSNSKLTSVNSNCGHCFLNCAELTTINLPNVTTIGYTGSSNWMNIANYSVFYNLPKLSAVYLPKVTSLSNAFYNCAMTSLSFPSLVTQVMAYPTTIVSDCQNLETLDLGNFVARRSTGGYDNTAYLVANCYNLKNLNLSKFQGHGDAFSGTSNSYGNYNNVLSRIGVETLNLPSLSYFDGRVGQTLISDCRNLSSLMLSALKTVRSYCAESVDRNSSLILGCPKLKTLELPALTSIYGGRRFIGAGQSNSSYTSVDYMKAQMQYYKDLYPTSYDTNDDYLKWQDRINGPYLTRYGDDISYKGQYCGLKVIKLPKLSRFSYNSDSNASLSSYPKNAFYYCDQLEELWLGDGTFTQEQDYLPYQFVYHAYNLRKVILNYPKILYAGNRLTSIFYDCPHLTGTKYSFNQTVNGVSKTYYYANEAGLKDLYFYVPDDLVESYKAASNWSTYASQIKPISALCDEVIEDEVIAQSKYANNQELTSMSGSNVKIINKSAFEGSSLSYGDFYQCSDIGINAFADCTDLTELVLDRINMTAINEGSFRNTALAKCEWPAVQTISKNAYKDCQNITAISLPVVKTIAESAFENAKLVEISLSQITKIGKAAFKNNTTIVSVSAPVIKTIEESAFENNVLTAVTLPVVTYLGAKAFKSNNIDSIELAECRTIDVSAFESNLLTSVSIPNISVIKDRAFANNATLANINIHEAAVIGDDVFDGCVSLQTITYEGYIMPTIGNIPETTVVHCRAELVSDFTAKFPNNMIVGDVE